MNKKGQIDQIQSIIPPLVGIAIILVVGFLIFAEIKSQVVDTDSKNWCGTGFTYYPAGVTCCNSTGGSTHCLNANSTVPGFGYSYNGTTSTQNAMLDIPGWLPIIVVAIIGVILIGLVKTFRN